MFFDPHDPEALATWLVKVYDEGASGPDVAPETLACEQLPERTKDFARRFVEMVKEVVVVL